MRYIGCLSGVVGALAMSCSAQAEPKAGQPTIEALMKKIDALQSRLDEVEGRQRVAKPSTAVTSRTASKPAAAAQALIPASTAAASRCGAAGSSADSRSASAGADGESNIMRGKAEMRCVLISPASHCVSPALKRKYASTALRRLRATVTSVPAIRTMRRRHSPFHSQAVRLTCRAAIWA